jgi:REP element-mobilizing transposase RayT
MFMPRAAQLPLALKTKTWGGFRAGAGRKRSRESGVSHLARPELSRHHPVHTTLRVAHGCWNLRSRRSLLALQGAFEGGRDRFGFRLIHYSLQGNHVHLLVEAVDKHSLSLGMQALTIRMARALNRMMRRHGKVFADRFHAHVLRSRREVAHALRYVFGNFAHHAKQWGAEIRATFCDPFSSVAWFAAEVPDDAPVTAPGTWLLRVGWRGAG